MPRHSTREHPIIALTAWEPERPAVRVNDHILMSPSTSNAYLVVTSAGDVVINTGTNVQGPRHRERFEALLGRPLQVRNVIFTQSHPDHTGGWSHFADEGVSLIVQREFARISAERKMLADFFWPRNRRVLAGMMLPRGQGLASNASGAGDPSDPIEFADQYAFELGERRFELRSTPSGETLDSLVVWMPDERTLFSGNFMGAIHGALPHFYTARGDRIRSVSRFLADIEICIGLAPDLLITGHGEPIRGRDRIAANLVKLRNAVAHIHDQTVRGMNAQKDLHSLMREIELPPHLRMEPGRGPTSWYVRAIWEEYAGWFHHRSTTELYDVPQRAIWPELASMAGGAQPLVEQARAHLAAGRPLEALHFVEIALASDPQHLGGLTAQISALEQLIARNGGRYFDELGWLENAIEQAEALLSQDQGS